MIPSEWQMDIQTRLDSAKAWLLTQLLDGDHWSLSGSTADDHWVTAGVMIEIGAYIAHTRKDVCQAVTQYLMEKPGALEDPRVLWGCITMWTALKMQQLSSLDTAIKNITLLEYDNTLSMACSCRILALGNNPGVAHKLFEEANWHSSALHQWKAWKIPFTAHQEAGSDKSIQHSTRSIRSKGNSPKVNLLLLTALTEEAQVVRGVLDIVAKRINDLGTIPLYEYRQVTSGARLIVATASAHSMGAVAMGIFTTQILKVVQPNSVILIGIAASVNNTLASRGDVPFASQVISYDDIAVQRGILTFRTQGFPVDPVMRIAIGELRSSYESYGPWQKDCVSIISKIIENLNNLRKQKINPPSQITPPHLIVELLAGGPFLIRDKDFRDSLAKQPKFPKYNAINIDTPIHPKLVSVERESHGFMRAAHELAIPASVLKGICDEGDDKKTRLEEMTGGFFRSYACSNATLAALHALRKNS
jgi:nucleoside phosphorylase